METGEIGFFSGDKWNKRAVDIPHFTNHDRPPLNAEFSDIR